MSTMERRSSFNDIFVFIKFTLTRPLPDQSNTIFYLKHFSNMESINYVFFYKQNEMTCVIYIEQGNAFILFENYFFRFIFFFELSNF